jgi:hypothetical protein
VRVVFEELIFTDISDYNRAKKEEARRTAFGIFPTCTESFEFWKNYYGPTELKNINYDDTDGIRTDLHWCRITLVEHGFDNLPEIGSVHRYAGPPCGWERKNV